MTELQAPETAATNESVGASPPADAQPASDQTVVSTPEFRAAVDHEVSARLQELERRWQSKKDREIHRERRRWQGQPEAELDPKLVAWVESADPAELGRWLKQELAVPSERGAPASPSPQPAEFADEFVAAAEDVETAHELDAAGAQAAARERLVADRAGEPSPDLTPGFSEPLDAFREIEARFARGEIGLTDYEAARRRRGLD